jgi:uncharacterized OsmC-like protein
MSIIQDSDDTIVSLLENGYVSTNIAGFFYQTSHPDFSGSTLSCPSAAQMFIAAVGACISTAIYKSCIKFGIDPENIKVSLKIDPDKKTEIGHTNVTIEVSEEFPAMYQWDLTRAAEDCIAYHALASKTDINIRVVMEGRAN